MYKDVSLSKNNVYDSLENKPAYKNYGHRKLRRDGTGKVHRAMLLGTTTLLI